MARIDVTVGADPELFLRNKRTGAYVSAHTYLRGSKDSPFPVAKGAVQVDGVAAEFNIIPALDLSDWTSNIRSVIKTLHDMVVERDPDLELVAIPTAEFDPAYFNALPGEVKMLGCTPDFDAWTGEVTQMAENSHERTYRTGGGHVHIGFAENADTDSAEHIHDCIQMTKQMDAAVFLPSLLFDQDRKRQRMYGKKGCFRPKVYGVEYRTPSNFWLSDPSLVSWMYEATVEAADMLLNERFNKSTLFDIPLFKAALERAPDITRAELLHVHDVSLSWGFPKLPEKYIQREAA